MNRYLLDTSALLTLRDDEAGADLVADLLFRAQKGELVCFGCFMTQMELLYCIWRDESEYAGRLAHEQCRSLPIQWVHEEQSLLEKAAELKAIYRMSVADAWITAAAVLQGATLVHKDPELEPLDCPQQILPYK